MPESRRTINFTATMGKPSGGAMNIRDRSYLEASAAAISAAVFILTAIEPQWFELIFNEAPDGGDGSLESVVALAVSLIAVVLFGRLARRDWRRAAAVNSGHPL